MYRTEKSSFNAAKQCKVLWVKQSKCRMLGVVEGEGIHLCWLKHTDGSTYCTCHDNQFRLGVCKHLVLLIKLFTKEEIVVD